MPSKCRDQNKESKPIIDNKELLHVIVSSHNHINEHFKISGLLAENLHYSKSLLHIIFTYEEIGRYTKYCTIYESGGHITKSMMRKLRDHNYKVRIFLEYILNLSRKEKLKNINKIYSNSPFNNTQEFLAILNKTEKNTSQVFESLPAIKELILYPDWWNGCSPQSIDIEDILSHYDIKLLVDHLFYLSATFASHIFKKFKYIDQIPYTITYPYITSLEQLEKNINNPNYIEERNIVEDLIKKLSIISECISDNKYTDDCEKIFQYLLERKRRALKL